MKHALYDPSTRQIVAIIRGAQRVAEQQATGGRALAPLPDDFAGDDTTHEIVDGVPVPLSPKV